MKYSTLAAVALRTALALPTGLVKRDSEPFGLVAVRTDAPEVDQKFVSVGEDGTLWINSDNTPLVGKVDSNTTLQELGENEYLNIGEDNEFRLKPDTSEPGFSIDNKFLRYKNTTQAIACYKYEKQYQVYWYREGFQCHDDDGNSVKTVNIKLQTVSVKKSKKQQNKALSMIIPLPYDLNLTMTMPAGAVQTSFDDYGDEFDLEDVAAMDEAASAVKEMGAAMTSGGRVATVEINPMRASAVVPITQQVKASASATATPTPTSAPATEESLKKRSPIVMDLAPEEPMYKRKRSPIVMNVAPKEPMVKRSMPNHKETWAGERQIGKLVPSLYPVGEDAPNKTARSRNSGQVSTLQGSHRVYTFAVFKVPAGLKHGRCELIFEKSHPVFTPMFHGGKTFEIWNVQDPVGSNVTWNNMPEHQGMVGSFSDGEFNPAGTFDCESGKYASFVMKPNPNHQNSSVSWWQHENGAGLKMLLLE